MSDLIHTALAWFGGLSALGYVAAAISLGIASVLEGRRLEAERAELRARPTPLTELDITSADFDAELITLIEGDQK